METKVFRTVVFEMTDAANGQKFMKPLRAANKT